MEVLDLFSGIGGFALGMERAGHRTVQFVEVDPSCQNVLNKNFPNVPIHSDISTFKPNRHYDIITGGFPCQDISVAGGLKGLSGNRSGLWYEYLRIINEVKPSYVVIENSPNLRSYGLQDVLKGLWESGYDAEWYCLEAGQFGAPHVRERLFIVAYPIGTRGERLVTDGDLESIRQRRVCSSKDLQGVFKEPFYRNIWLGDSWPEPLLRRENDGLYRRVDRLKQIGNSVYPPIVQFIGECIGRGV